MYKKLQQSAKWALILQSLVLMFQYKTYYGYDFICQHSTYLYVFAGIALGMTGARWVRWVIA